MSSETVYHCDYCGKKISPDDYRYPPDQLVITVKVLDDFDASSWNLTANNPVPGLPEALHFHASPVGCETSNKIRCYEQFCKSVSKILAAGKAS